MKPREDCKLVIRPRVIHFDTMPPHGSQIGDPKRPQLSLNYTGCLDSPAGNRTSPNIPWISYFRSKMVRSSLGMLFRVTANVTVQYSPYRYRYPTSPTLRLHEGSVQIAASLREKLRGKARPGLCPQHSCRKLGCNALPNRTTTNPVLCIYHFHCDYAHNPRPTRYRGEAAKTW